MYICMRVCYMYCVYERMNIASYVSTLFLMYVCTVCMYVCIYIIIFYWTPTTSNIPSRPIKTLTCTCMYVCIYVFVFMKIIIIMFMYVCMSCLSAPSCGSAKMAWSSTGELGNNWLRVEVLSMCMYVCMYVCTYMSSCLKPDDKCACMYVCM